MCLVVSVCLSVCMLKRPRIGHVRTTTWWFVMFTLRTNQATGAHDVIDVCIVGSLHVNITNHHVLVCTWPIWDHFNIIRFRWPLYW